MSLQWDRLSEIMGRRLRHVFTMAFISCSEAERPRFAGCKPWLIWAASCNSIICCAAWNSIRWPLTSLLGRIIGKSKNLMNRNIEKFAAILQTIVWYHPIKFRIQMFNILRVIIHFLTFDLVAGSYDRKIEKSHKSKYRKICCNPADYCLVLSDKDSNPKVQYFTCYNSFIDVWFRCWVVWSENRKIS